MKRVYTKADVERLRGSIKIEHTLAKLGAERLWNLLHSEPYLHALGAFTGGQAVQMVAGGKHSRLACWWPCVMFCSMSATFLNGSTGSFVPAGLKSIYLSGWQVAADANSAGQTYPDQSLYPADSVPKIVKVRPFAAFAMLAIPELCTYVPLRVPFLQRLNNAFQRADQIQHAEGKNDIHWFAPIVADAEAGECLAA